ncbi:Asparagine synthetase domain-containing protein 1-like [Oopsacas minuta]|uniref:Asparagine synthetase domain-containing protein 1-like n=1 Tax=Oopsacas minuta TaxID=111878 RepID=A0AAV7JWD6_9METZ|nr:Asparagine synthetase domain-containing protein 1-like [Oopsacas minuta]
MCGILVLLFYSQALPYEWVDKLYHFINRRGPDGAGEKTIPVKGGEFSLRLIATLLRMRGLVAILQPKSDKSGNSLLFNGEIFSGYDIADGDNDTVVLFSALVSCSGAEPLLKCIADIRGPWALVFWRQNARELWFGRDIFGRRSLLIGHNPSCGVPIIISSVGYHTDGLECIELPAVGLFCMDLSVEGTPLALKCYPWLTVDGTSMSYVDDVMEAVASIEKLLSLKVDIICSSSFISMIPPLNRVLSPIHPHDLIPPVDINSATSNATQLLAVLQEAVRLRVCNRPWSISTVNHAPVPTQVVIQESLGDTALSELVKSKPQISPQQGTAKVGILFSGGLDSAVIAALVDRELPIEEEIDLLNVSFIKSNTSTAVAPDRQTGLSCLAQLNPNRHWNFVQIDTCLTELSQIRKDNTEQLIYPLTTVMDDSIGTPVWLAAMGLGHLYQQQAATYIPYQSNARILLVGMGADEQLGGYTRHRNLFEKGGWERLLTEIEFDLRRISVRNLGRDDRCISDHGKEARFPFLDEEVVSFLQKLPLNDKMDLSLTRGQGDKKVLREVANILGLEFSAKLPKKAIQFGSNFAKVTGSTKFKAGEQIFFQKNQF